MAAVVTDVEPRNTARLLEGTELEAQFAERVRGTQPTSMLAISFSTREDILPKVPGMLPYADTRRLCSLGNLTALCPELAPPGPALYDWNASPWPSVVFCFDEEYERSLAGGRPPRGRAGIRHRVQGDARRQVARTAVRARATGPDVRTPLLNLVDVGDGVKPLG